MVGYKPKSKRNENSRRNKIKNIFYVTIVDIFHDGETNEDWYLFKNNNVAPLETRAKIYSKIKKKYISLTIKNSYVYYCNVEKASKLKKNINTRPTYTYFWNTTYLVDGP